MTSFKGEDGGAFLRELDRTTERLKLKDPTLTHLDFFPLFVESDRSFEWYLLGGSGSRKIVS
jgi:hypothetical protein